MKTRERKHGWVRMVAVAAMIAIAGTGCSVLDSIDMQLQKWGVVDAIDGAGIDTLAVVQVVCDRQVGVGVVIEGGLIFTANHVVAGQDTVIVRTNGYYHDAWHQVLTARVVYRNAAADQALLRIERGSSIKHTVELGECRRGSAKVLPMRVVGRAATGDAVRRAVVRELEVRGPGRIAKSDRITYGDSGCPIVQYGKVVGLVLGEGRMINADVMANYKASRNIEGQSKAESKDPVQTGVAVPECCAKNRTPARS